MTDTSINVTTFTQDDGTGVTNGSEDYSSAALFALLNGYLGGEYVGNGLAFTDVNQNQNTVDITAGHCYIIDDVSRSGGSRTNRPVVQSGGSAYNFTLPFRKE